VKIGETVLKKTLLTAAIVLTATNVKAAETEDIVIATAVGAGTVATVAAAAAPVVVAHSSGAMIMYSGAGYVAGTIGVAAGTVAVLPVIAVGAAVVGTGAVIYKYSDDIAKTDSFQAAKSYGQSVLTYYGW
jgi:hypothetical protein